MIIFQGQQFAKQKELELLQRVKNLSPGHHLKIAAILFQEDKGSQLYTRLKKEAAERVGIGYAVASFSMSDEVAGILSKLNHLNNDASVTGIIIQKPAKTVWQSVTQGSAEDFQTWWQTLVTQIKPQKDVDGLHPNTLSHIQKGDWQQTGCVMPATAKAVLLILAEAEKQLGELGKIVILGKSDILGQPLYYEFKNQGKHVEMIGSKELQQKIEQGVGLKDAQVVISATGRPRLITGDLLAENSVVIDVGEPQPDVDRESVSLKAAFLTPVPGGVGPVTIVSLLENAIHLGT